MKKNILFIASFIITVIICNSSASAQDTDPADKIKEDVEFLSSQEMQGRFPGTPGSKKAADYIVKNFNDHGLQKIGGSFKQEFPFPAGLAPGKDNSVYFEVVIPKPGIPKDRLRPMKRPWEMGKDWMPSPFSKNGSASGELAFVGYGISAPELEYDDYAGIDVSDKVVVILTESPDSNNTKSPFYKYTKFDYKIDNAKKHGAAGIVFINISGDSANVFLPLEEYTPANVSDMVAIQANRDELSRFFPKQHPLGGTEDKIGKTKQPISFILPNAKIFINVNLIAKEELTQNVIGMVPGIDSELKDEYIIVGAHYDHLGLTKAPATRRLFFKQEVYNGADDNASGVAAMLQLARRLSMNPMKRTVIFAAFGAEEMKQLGSKYYLDNPLMPLEKTAAFINLDMVGRMKGSRLYAFGAGSAPQLEDALFDVLAFSDMNVIKNYNGFGAGDYSEFYGTRIPSVLFTTGIHDDYHQTTDDARLIKESGIVEIVDFTDKFVPRLDDYARSAFTDAGDITRNAADEVMICPLELGIIPEFKADGDGIEVVNIMSGTPAKVSKLKAGDIITEIDGSAVSDPFKLAEAMKNKSAGDKILLNVEREGEEEPLKIEITLSER